MLQLKIQSAEVDFQKIEVHFVDLLTEEELEELCVDKLAQGEIAKQEIDLSLQLKAAVQLTDGQRGSRRSMIRWTKTEQQYMTGSSKPNR
jgi:hypothetical protein